MNTVIVHHMHLVERLTDGATRWHCDICGRDVVWGQGYASLTVRVEGDLTAQHQGSVGGLELEMLAVEPAEEEPLPREFQEWLEKWEAEHGQ